MLRVLYFDTASISDTAFLHLSLLLLPLRPFSLCPPLAPSLILSPTPLSPHSPAPLPAAPLRRWPTTPHGRSSAPIPTRAAKTGTSASPRCRRSRVSGSRARPAGSCTVLAEMPDA